MMMSNERTPLLNDAATGAVQPTTEVRLCGPLEITAANRRGISTGVWMATFLCSLNSTLVATLVSSISSEFEKSNHASWLGTAFLLATCTFTPLYGRLCDVMGRRAANQTAVVFAGLGTLCCGLSTNMNMLIVSRFLSGLGSGGTFMTTTVIISDMYSMRDRGLASGIANIFNGLGLGLGGPIGGFVNDRFGWRWAFIMQIPLFVVSFFLTGHNLRYVTPGKGKSTREIIKRIDYGGTLTLLAAMGSLLFFLSYKYNDELSWHAPTVLTTLAMFFALFVLFILVELLVAPEPVLAPFLLQQKIPVLISLSNFLVAMSQFAVLYFLPMWFETVQLTSPSIAGLHLLPNSVAMSCGSLFAGQILHKTGKYRTLNLVFGAFTIVATVMLSALSERSSMFIQWISVVHVPLGFGEAVIMQTTLIALIAHIDRSEMAVATGFGQLWRGIGQLFGVAVASAIFQSTLARELSKRVTGPGAADTIRQIQHSSRLVATLPPTLQRAARDSYGIAIQRVFIYAAVSSILGYLVRLAIPDRSLEDPRLTMNRGTGSDSEAPNAAESVEPSTDWDDAAVAKKEEEYNNEIPPSGPRPVQGLRAMNGRLDEDPMVGSARHWLQVGSLVD